MNFYWRGSIGISMCCVGCEWSSPASQTCSCSPLFPALLSSNSQISRFFFFQVVICGFVVPPLAPGLKFLHSGATGIRDCFVDGDSLQTTSFHMLMGRNGEIGTASFWHKNKSFFKSINIFKRRSPNTTWMP